MMFKLFSSLAKSIISEEVIQNYIVKDFVVIPNIVDWVLELKWQETLVDEVTRIVIIVRQLQIFTRSDY